MEVAREAKANPKQTVNYSLQHAYAIPSKLLGGSYYKDKGWGRAYADTMVMGGINIATIVVQGKLINRSFGLRNEWEADRFMLALTKDKDACHRAFTKLGEATEERLAERAKNPVQKRFAEKVSSAINDFIKHNLMAHPEIADRLEHIRLADVEKLAGRYHL
jgi:Zn-dependent protease with chaperone function